MAGINSVYQELYNIIKNINNLSGLPCAYCKYVLGSGQDYILKLITQKLVKKSHLNVYLLVWLYLKNKTKLLFKLAITPSN